MILPQNKLECLFVPCKLFDSSLMLVGKVKSKPQNWNFKVLQPHSQILKKFVSIPR